MKHRLQWNAGCNETLTAMKHRLQWNTDCNETLSAMKHRLQWNTDCNETPTAMKHRLQDCNETLTAMKHRLQWNTKWAQSSEFVSSSISSWQILTAHAQPFRGARDLAFCLKVPLDSLLVWASSGGSGETAWMRWLAWTFAACIANKYQIRLTRSK